ncbi:putative RNA-directed DNA polymerase from transposon X-element [Araneus ventricosus]|uniref:Putative RNA-directed DNA polymerase from transposon X-element n=1 Tax=Araneus ventricosus TaxID=182803 RepID=A0A4Y2RAN2_ARAVE|nr:putative RNA-directed DNA polymerase from transposon X-element [Araneus ventricosus]
MSEDGHSRSTLSSSSTAYSDHLTKSMHELQFLTIDWKNFKKHLNDNVKLSLPDINDNLSLEQQFKTITDDILRAYQNSSRPLKDSEELFLPPPQIRQIKTERNHFKKIWQKYRTPANKNKYNSAQTKLRRAITKHIQDTYALSIEHLNIIEGTLWRRAKYLKTKRNNIPKLKNPADNSSASTNVEKAEVIADHFVNQFQINDIGNPRTENTVKTSIENFDTTKVRLSEITEFIKSTKINKAPGIDGITNKMLKNLPLKILLKLANLYNYMFKLKYFPQCWKTARILPILKPGKDPTKPISYRPISLLSTLSKLGEKLILTRYLKHARRIRIPIPQQFGFTPKLSTTHQLLRVVEHILEGKSSKLITAAIFLDIAKAFDKVWTQGLIHKLISYKFPHYIIAIIQSYLQDRHFTVSVNNTDSTPQAISAGVPQGGFWPPSYSYAL